PLHAHRHIHPIEPHSFPTRRSSDLAPLEPTVESVGEIDTSIAPSITAVGSTPVVLDAAEGTVVTPGGLRTEIGQADGAVLQMASDRKSTRLNSSHVKRS